MKSLVYIFLFTLGLIILSCIRAPDYPIEPVIEYQGMSKYTMEQGNLNTDSIFLYFSFTDGDGDIGYELQENKFNIGLIDSRTGDTTEYFKTPFVPEEGIGNGIVGDVELLVYNTCCLFPDNIPPCRNPEQYPSDTLKYQIFMTDRAGNRSNIVETEPIILDCTK